MEAISSNCSVKPGYQFWAEYPIIQAELKTRQFLNTEVILYSILLFLGFGLSQALPALLGDAHNTFSTLIRVLTMTGLAYIMIHVGFEFHIDKARLGSYGKDYPIAFTAAFFP